MKENNRFSGIELLRILSACAVVMLHYNDGRAFEYVQNGSLNEIFLYLFESLCICAVDMFILICGYFSSCSQKRSMLKPFELYFEIVLIKYGMFFVRAVLKALRGIESFSFGVFVQAIPSCLLLSNYFVVFYIILYFLSPFINILLDQLDSKKIRVLVITMLLIFSFYAIFVDLFTEIFDTEIMGMSPVTAWGNKQGFNIVNFVLMYIIGAYIRRQKPLEIIKSNKLVFAVVVNTVIITIWAFINTKLSKHGLISAWVYHNPLVILQAVLIFSIFSRLKFKNAIVNNLAEASFTCYLVHGYLLSALKIQWATAQSLPIMLLHICASLLTIYSISWIIYHIYRLCTGWLLNVLSKFKIFQSYSI